METVNSGPCGFCKASSALLCSTCKLMFYCDKTCQTQHLKDHKKTCFPTTENVAYEKYAKLLRKCHSKMDDFKYSTYYSYLRYKNPDLEIDWVKIIEHFLAKTAKAKPRDLKLLKTFTEALVRFFKWDETSNTWMTYGDMRITPLHWAVNHKEMEFINILPLKMIDMTYGCYNGYTSLSLACYHNMVDLVEKMIKSAKKGAPVLSRVDTNGKHEMCFTPLFITCQRGHIKILELFLKYSDKKKIDLNHICNKTGYTALHVLCLRSCYSSLDFNLRHHDAQYRDENEEEDYREIVDNSVSLVELMLKNAEDKKIDIFIKDGPLHRQNGWSPFEVAISHGKMKIFNVFMEYFEEKKIFLNEYEMNPLIAACKRTEEPNAGWDEVHTKSEKERTEIVKILLQYSKDKGVNLYIQDGIGRSALHHACASGSIEIFDLLIQSGLKYNINDQDDNGRTPLHHTCSISGKACPYSEEMPQRDPKMLKHLLSKTEELGIDVEITDKECQTPLEAARTLNTSTCYQFRDSKLQELLAVFQEYGITDDSEDEFMEDNDSNSEDYEEDSEDNDDMVDGA